MMQLPIFPPVQYSKPMPPCVRMRPSSTVSPPGPTCFHPVRSLPLKSCCHFPVSPLQTFSSAAIARVASPATRKMHTVNRFSMGDLLEFPAWLSLGTDQSTRPSKENQSAVTDVATAASAVPPARSAAEPQGIYLRRFSLTLRTPS